jgi:hypothetical protein
MFTEGEVNGKPRRRNDLARRKWLRDAKTGAFHGPAAVPLHERQGPHLRPMAARRSAALEVPRADDAIITPAVQAVAQLQRRRLSRSLDCAYVRPEAVDGRPAYAAFAGPGNAALRDYCIEMRKRLLTHPDRMKVEYETVREVDKEYAAQRAAAKIGKKLGANAEPLDPKDPAPDAARPLQGGLPFDPGGDDEPGRRWLGPVLLGGAALATTIGVAIGVKRWRAARA